MPFREFRLAVCGLGHVCRELVSDGELIDFAGTIELGAGRQTQVHIAAGKSLRYREAPQLLDDRGAAI